MAIFLSFPIMAIAAVLQATFVPQIRLLGGGPDLVYLLVLSWAINANLDSSVIWAFVGGIMVDLISSTPTGTTTLGILLTVFAISGLGRQVYRIGFLILIGIVIFGTVAHQLVLMIILTMAGYQVDWLFSLGFIVAPTILYNLVFVWPIYWLIRRLQQRLDRRGAFFLND
ncbi:MAG: rod shape-determining protein MreD [Chloroflexota bacterium]